MMKKINFRLTIVIVFLFYLNFFVFPQNLISEKYLPFEKSIPSPEDFLGYRIGDSHTRHDKVVSYLTKLAELSDRVKLTTYRKTNENLTITSLENHHNLSEIKRKYLQVINHNMDITDYNDLPYL